MARFKPGQSGNTKGKPRGTKSRFTKYRDAIDKDLPKLLDKTKQAALGGDMTAMKLLLERTLPPQKSIAAPVKVPGLEEAEGLADKAEAVLDAVSQGNVPPDIGCQLVNAIGSLGALRELQDVEERLAYLEKQLQKSN